MDSGIPSIGRLIWTVFYLKVFLKILKGNTPPGYIMYALGNSEGFIYLILEIQHFCFTPKNQ